MFDSRVSRANARPLPPAHARSFVGLWVQSSVRGAHNRALDYASAAANALGVGVTALFGLTDRFPGANERSFA
jgi:hypothetical protein